MKRVMVRYVVKADRAEDNVRFVKAVFAQLERDRPPGLRYATFRFEDGISFVHIASIETEDGTNPLSSVAAFKEFSSQIADRCEEGPVTTALTEVGSYRFFGG